jgi:hypothetical protein
VHRQARPGGEHVRGLEQDGGDADAQRAAEHALLRQLRAATSHLTGCPGA